MALQLLALKARLRESQRDEVALKCSCTSPTILANESVISFLPLSCKRASFRPVRPAKMLPQTSFSGDCALHRQPWRQDRRLVEGHEAF